MNNEIKNTNNELYKRLRVSIMKPFPDIRLGGRLKAEVAENVADLYNGKNTYLLKDGTTGNRNEYVLNQVLSDPVLQEWTDIIFKVSGLESDEYNEISNTIEKIHVESLGGDLWFFKVDMRVLLESLYKIDSSESSSELLKAFAKKAVSAMNRVIKMQIDAPFVFTAFYKKYKELKNNG